MSSRSSGWFVPGPSLGRAACWCLPTIPTYAGCSRRAWGPRHSGGCHPLGPRGRGVADALVPSIIIADLGLLRREPWTELRSLTARSALAQLPVLGISIDRGSAVMLPLGGLLPTPPDRARLHERVATVAEPSLPILVFGAGLGVARPLRELDYEVVEVQTVEEAEAGLAGAGLLIVDLLANQAAGLAFAAGARAGHPDDWAPPSRSQRGSARCVPPGVGPAGTRARCIRRVCTRRAGAPPRPSQRCRYGAGGPPEASDGPAASSAPARP